MKNNNSNRLINKLDGVWKDVYQFLQNNKDVAGIGPLAIFADTLKHFKYDTAYVHPTKQVYIHRTDEWNIHVCPWMPCERTISFEKKAKNVVVSISSKVKGEKVVNEQTLVLSEDKDGRWEGRLSSIGENDVYTFYSFAISKNGNVKARTFKKSYTSEAQNTTSKQKAKTDGEGK